MPLVLAPLLLLAAGKSQRTASPKGLISVGKRFWIEQQLASFAEAGGTWVRVVLGFHEALFRGSCPWLTDGWFEGLQVEAVSNPAPERGAFSSIKVGLAGREEAWFILPIDVPAPEREVWGMLLTALGSHWVAQPTFEGRGGHPILISKTFVESLRSSPDLSRLDHKIQALQESKRVRVPVPSAHVLRNLNTLADWSHFIARWPLN